VEASYLVGFPREYVLPRNPTTNKIRLPNEPKYDNVTPMIPSGVTIEGDILRIIGNLWFSDHDLTYLKIFLELASHNYLRTRINPDSLVLIVEPQYWAKGLQ
jgi:hypothetical protein